MSANAKSIPAAHSAPAHTASVTPDDATNISDSASVTETTGTTPASKLGILFPVVLTIVAILPIAYGVGAARLKASVTAAKAEDDARIVQAEQDLESAPELPRPMDRRLGDRQFLERRYEVALQYYQSLGSPNAARLPSDLLYRIALCQEGLGLWDEALVSLQTVSDGTENSTLRAAAGFGQARIWIRLNKHAKAETLLRALEFHKYAQHPMPKNMSREIAFLIPLMLAQEAIPQVVTTGNDEPLNFGDLMFWSLETALAWADEETIDTQASERDPSACDASAPVNTVRCRVKRLPPTGTNSTLVDDALVDINSQEQSLGAIIERVADACEWKLDWSDLVHDASPQRIVRMTIENRPISLVLTEICSELRANWSVSDNQLVIARSDTDGSRQRLMIARTLASLTAWNPNHRLSDHARFAQGQLAEASGELLDAARLFSSLLGRDSSPLAIRAAYNSATDFYRIGDFASACLQLRIVVDGAPEQRLHAPALIFLGRLLLDRGEIQDAIYQFRRATEARGRPHEQARAAVFLGMSFIMQDKYQEAAEAVFAQKPLLEEQSTCHAAAFVTALARWQAISDEMREHEATFLYRALICMKADSEWLGQTGQLLIGRADRELGFDDQMADLYSHQLSIGMTESIESEMTYSLAAYELANGRVEAACALWTKLTLATSNRWANQARLRLAEVALTEGRANDSLEICEQIHSSDGITRGEIQKLMGRAFEQLGEDVLAARCYAGQLPAH